MTLMIVTVVLPEVQGSLSATQDQIALALTFQPRGDRRRDPDDGLACRPVGRRRLMLAALLGFIASTIACGFANSLASLVVFRILQGAFGAPMVPLAQAIMLDTYPRHQHGFAQSVFGMGVGAPAHLGRPAPWKPLPSAPAGGGKQIPGQSALPFEAWETTAPNGPDSAGRDASLRRFFAERGKLRL